MPFFKSVSLYLNFGTSLEFNREYVEKFCLFQNMQKSTKKKAYKDKKQEY